jgi:hypothetical protein
MPISAAPTVRESLESAMENVVDTPAPGIPAQEAPAPKADIKAETPQAPAQETEEQKAERLRNKDGTFAKGKPEQVKPAEPAKPAEPVKPKAPRPSSWKKDLEGQWDALVPEVQAYIGQREKEYATGVSTYKNEADRAKGVMSALSEFEPLLQQHGIQADKWIASMGQAHRILATGTPQDKVTMMQQIIANNRIPVQLAIQDAQGQWQLLGQAQPQPQQPQISQQDIDARIQRTVNDSLANNRAEHEYKAFTEARNEKGESKYPHFEAVKATMAGLLQAELAQDYPSAYEAALRMPQHAELWNAMQQQQASEKEAERLAAAKAQVGRARSQAVSVKSSTPTALTQQTDGKKDLRGTLSDAFDTVTSGRV